jgi:hypothetical protein
LFVKNNPGDRHLIFRPDNGTGQPLHPVRHDPPDSKKEPFHPSAVAPINSSQPIQELFIGRILVGVTT